MSIPLSKLASLDLLRGFVAVGRRMSITLAAQDLFLTQSAVSRQIHGLETVLGVKLFHRGHRSLGFTADGERLFRAADSSMQQLQDAIGTLHDSRRRRPVTLTASTGFVGLWLVPRLADFQALHPKIEIRLSASNELLDLQREGIDIAVRYCAREAMPPGARLLFGEHIAPVAHPMLAINRLDDPEVITRSVLLEFEGHRSQSWSWRSFLESQGWGGVTPKGMLRFNQYDQMIHAAMAGHGIALGRTELLSTMLADGRLIALPTAQPGPASHHVYCLIQADAQTTPEVETVVGWIEKLAGAMANECDLSLIH